MTQISGLMFGLLALQIAGSSAAQTTYPEKPIHLVVGLPPGAQIDTVARLLGPKFAEALGKPVLIDNVPGAAGNIGADRVANAAPDGYTLGLLAQGAIVINPILYKLAFDPVKDFAPVSQIAVSPNMLVVHNPAPAGAQTAVLFGDPTKPGPYTMRAKFPPNTKDPPHTHPDNRQATVISGTWYFGHGDKIEPEKATRVAQAPSLPNRQTRFTTTSRPLRRLSCKSAGQGRQQQIASSNGSLRGAA